MPYKYNRRFRTVKNFDGFDEEADASDSPDSPNPAQAAPLLSAEAEHELAMRIKAGDSTARDELAVANLGLVVSIAVQFKARGLDLDDLIQEGNLGLLRATRDFDPETHGAKFSTYATYWIRHMLMRATSDKGSMIHLPYYLAALRQRFDRVKAEMIRERRSELGGPRHQPTMEEVAERMGVKPRRLRFLKQAQVDCVSYSTSALAAEDAGAPEGLIAEALPPEKPLEIAEEMEALHAALDRLPPFEAWLICRRFRLDDRYGADAGDARNGSPRALTPRSRELEWRRVKRATKRESEPRTYRELKSECGLEVYQIKEIEREALLKLRRALAGTSQSSHLPNPSDRNETTLRRRATA